MNKPRVGDWWQTYTGRQFWSLDPRPEDFCITDIAHHLSILPRFCGATEDHYSVGQHCLVVAELLREWGAPVEIQYEGLMHDAVEAYTSDAVRPRKYSFPELIAEEERIWKPLAVPFDLPESLHQLNPAVKSADNVALVTERRDLMRPTQYGWAECVEEWPTLIIPMKCKEVEEHFLTKFLIMRRLLGAHQ